MAYSWLKKNVHEFIQCLSRETQSDYCNDSSNPQGRGAHAKLCAPRGGLFESVNLKGLPKLFYHLYFPPTRLQPNYLKLSLCHEYFDVLSQFGYCNLF